jgi:hypothetical protein
MQFLALLASRQRSVMAVGRGEHGLENHADRNFPGLIQSADDFPGMLADLGERLLTIKMLAPGNKPYFQIFQDHHEPVPLFFQLTA